MSINNPFTESLKNFKTSKRVEAGGESLIKDEPVTRDEVSLARPDSERKEETNEMIIDEKKLKEQVEDEQLLEELATELNISSKEKAFFGLKRAIMGSRKEDYSYEINRWTRGLKLSQRAKEILDQILKRGYEAGALGWLLSLTPKGLGTGSGSSELRLAEAKKLAEKAGIPLEEIARKNNLRIKMG